MVVGIDFSINSPAVCLLTEDSQKFYSVFNKKKLYAGKTKLTDSEFINKYEHLKLLADAGVKFDFSEHTSDKKDSLYFFSSSYERYEFTANKIFQFLLDNKVSKLTPIVFEGYSFSSQTSSIIDLAEATYSLKSKIAGHFSHPLIVPPTTIKKDITGKGNANKEKMLAEFLSEDIPLAKVVREKLDAFVKNEAVKSPLDDIIDSYFVAKWLVNFG
jgi:hypothetical protein